MKKRVLDIITEVSDALHVVPELTHVGNPVLRTACTAATVAEGVKIAQSLLKVLEKYRKMAHGIGAGLAAPQIGISKKVFVTIGKDGSEVYINPEILSYSKEKNLYRESCLSSRMMWGDVKRSESIEMKWIDRDSKERQEKFSDFPARLLQHEYDHLLGEVCLDKAVSGTIEYSGDVKEEKLRETLK
ncbi:MAG: peptide deformylase [Candidatus Roizmanbacteria bacterium]